MSHSSSWQDPDPPDMIAPRYDSRTPQSASVWHVQLLAIWMDAVDAVPFASFLYERAKLFYRLVLGSTRPGYKRDLTAAR